jgi:hypothetical protein
MEPEMRVAVAAKVETDLLSTTARLCGSATRAVIDSPATLVKGADLAKMIRVALKTADDERKTLVEPLNGVVKTINLRFKRYTGPLEEAKMLIDGKMVAYGRKVADAQRVEDEKRRKEEDAVRAEEFPDEMPFTPPTAAPKPVTVYGNTGSAASFTNTWDFEVTSATEVPREYLVPDEKKIRQAVKDGVRTIPGVNIFEKTGLRVR